MLSTLEAPTISRHHATSAKEVMDHFRAHHRKVLLTVNTQYLAPTDTDGSRYTATAAHNGQFAFTFANYALTVPENHLAAAMSLIEAIFLPTQPGPQDCVWLRPPRAARI